MEVEQMLVDLVKERDSLEKDSDDAKAIVEKLRLIGQTASFFGGYDAMKKLHDAAEALVGFDNSVGYTLNYAWDGIGGWWA